MSTKRLNLKTEGTKCFLEITGVMDEDLSYTDFQLNNATELIVNFEKVQSINSCGIREWIRWLMLYPKLRTIYKMCPKVIVDQINMVDGFLPKNGSVESFYVPYYSQESGSELHVLFNQGKDFDNNGLHAPNDVRDQKGHLMEMDVIESKYFRFLTKKPTAA